MKLTYLDNARLLDRLQVETMVNCCTLKLEEGKVSVNY